MMSGKPSEKRLLWILGGVVFLIVNFLLLEWGVKRIGEQVRERRELVGGLESDRLILESSDDDSLEREQWLRAAQPTLPDVPAAPLLTRLTEASKVHRVSFSRSYQPDKELKHEQFYSGVGVSFEVEGTLPDVFGFLYELQTPESFFSLSDLKVEPMGADSSRVRCSARIEALYVPINEGGGAV